MRYIEWNKDTKEVKYCCLELMIDGVAAHVLDATVDVSGVPEKYMSTVMNSLGCVKLHSRSDFYDPEYMRRSNAWVEEWTRRRKEYSDKHWLKRLFSFRPELPPDWEDEYAASKSGKST